VPANMRTMPNPRQAPARPRAGARAAAKRAPLTRERIARAALELVQRHGLAALSTRRLGTQLRCEAMSIYHHFPSKGHLLDAMVDHAIASIEAPPAGLGPVERLRFADWLDALPA